jgi:hypothetical protein
MNEIASTFIFAIHEGLSKLTHSRDLWVLTLNGTLSVFVVFRLLNSKTLLMAALLGVSGSWLLVKLQQLAPQEILMNIFGIPLPWFTMLSLIIPLAVATIALIFSLVLTPRRSVLPGYAALAIVILMIACNIGLLQNANLANIRSQDYTTNIMKLSYILGMLLMETIVLLPVPAIVGALNMSAHQEKMRRVIVSALALAAAAYVYWSLRDIQPLKLLHWLIGY